MIKAILNIVLAALCSSMSVWATASVDVAEMPSHVAFSIDGRAFAYKAVSHLIGETKKHNPSLKAESLVKGLIENHLLVASLAADDVHHEHGSHHKEKDGHSDSHGGHDSHIAEHAEYTHQIGINVQAMSEYDQLLNSIQSIGSSADLDRYIVKTADNALENLRSVLRDNEKNVMGNEDLSHVQIGHVKGINVLSYKLNNTIHNVSYWDVFSYSNVHDRTRLRRADKDTIHKRALTFLARDYQRYQIVAHADWNLQDLADLKQFVFDKVEKQAHFKNMGIIADLHHDTPALQRFIEQVSEEEIKRYYQDNKDEFMQVSSVKARHITVPTQKIADLVYEEIKGGLSFVDAIKKYSIDEDKNGNPPGSLGKIDKNTQGLTFRKKLSLIQPVGKVSTPYRMLDGKSYEIILVDEKLPEHLPLTDKSVYRSIVNKLARGKSAQYVEHLKNQLVSESSIRLNKHYYPNVRW